MQSFSKRICTSLFEKNLKEIYEINIFYKPQKWYTTYTLSLNKRIFQNLRIKSLCTHIQKLEIRKIVPVCLRVAIFQNCKVDSFEKEEGNTYIDNKYRS